MSKFKVGDLIICPEKPSNAAIQESRAGWSYCGGMDAIIGEKMKVEGIDGDGDILAGDFCWDPSWVELAGDES